MDAITVRRMINLKGECLAFPYGNGLHPICHINPNLLRMMKTKSVLVVLQRTSTFRPAWIFLRCRERNKRQRNCKRLDKIETHRMARAARQFFGPICHAFCILLNDLESRSVRSIRHTFCSFNIKVPSFICARIHVVVGGVCLPPVSGIG